MSGLSCKALDELSQRDREQLDLAHYVRVGCCVLFGTLDCLECTLVRPLAECDPPGDCPKCPDRARCPCGSNVVSKAEAIIDPISV